MPLTLALEGLTPIEITELFLGLAVLLGLARLLGEIARQFRQPSILGEIAAGILLGPTILGFIAPEAYAWLFPQTGGASVAMQGLITLSAALLLLVAGLEVDLSTVWRQGKSTLIVSAAGITVPFALGFSLAWLLPGLLGFDMDEALHLPFALFVGISLSITALPIIAKVLMDLNLSKSDFGVMIIASAMVNDLVGWLGFAVILAMMASGPAEAALEHAPEAQGGGPDVVQVEQLRGDATTSEGTLAQPPVAPSDTKPTAPTAAPANGHDTAEASAESESHAAEADSGGHGHGGGGASTVIKTIAFTLIFLGAMLTLGKFLFHRSLPFIQAHGSYPGAVLSFVMVIALICASFTEFIGIHSIFGAFIAGVAIGDSHHLRVRTREVIHEFITNIFAPLFFASIGLYINFFTSFDPLMVVVVFAIALIGKVGGSYAGARISGFDHRISMAVGAGLAAQGTMGVILGQLARSAGLISDDLFVAIIIMAIGTSLLSGPAMERILQRKQKRRLQDVLGDRNFIADLKARTVRDTIEEMSARAGEVTALDQQDIYDAVWEREQIIHTGIGHGLAVPHARFADLKRPVVILGRSHEGVDFDAPDGEPARFICLLLTPLDDPDAQIELLDACARTFSDPETRQGSLEAKNYTELLATFNRTQKTHAEEAPA